MDVITFIMNTLSLLLLLQPQYCWREVGCERYNCLDYTATAVIALRELGHDAYPMCGYAGYGGFHYWVGVNINGTEVEFEPMTGKVVRSYEVDEIFDYISTWGEYPMYRFGKRCVARGVA